MQKWLGKKSAHGTISMYSSLVNYKYLKFEDKLVVDMF